MAFEADRYRDWTDRAQTVVDFAIDQTDAEWISQINAQSFNHLEDTELERIFVMRATLQQEIMERLEANGDEHVLENARARYKKILQFVIENFPLIEKLKKDVDMWTIEALQQRYDTWMKDFDRMDRTFLQYLFLLLQLESSRLPLSLEEKEEFEQIRVLTALYCELIRDLEQQESH